MQNDATGGKPPVAATSPSVPDGGIIPARFVPSFPTEKAMPHKSLSCLVLLSALGAQAPAPATLENPGRTGSTSPNAATATYALFGDSCGGGCAALNDNRSALRTGTLPNEYSYGHRFTAATVIVGFQLYTRTDVLPQASMTCAVYRESTSPGIPDGTPVTTGTMTVNNTVDFYGVMLSQPVVVQANEAIWISQYESTAILAAGLAAGTAPALSTYWRRPAGQGTWAVTGIVSFPAWRILCSNSTAFLTRDVPKLGGQMNLMLQGAPASSPAVFVFGIRSPNLPTPFCTSLYSTFDIVLNSNTNASGGATFQLNVPNTPALDGGVFYNQWWVVGPGPRVVGSNGGMGTAGM